MPVAISRTDLARHTREIVDQVRRGQTVVVQSYGEDQVVILDVLDYHILRALVDYALRQDSGLSSGSTSVVIHRYLHEQISLAKAAEALGLSRFELMERFERLGISLRLGPSTLKEAREEIASAQQGKTSPE